jgi:hypothetical protein
VKLVVDTRGVMRRVSASARVVGLSQKETAGSIAGPAA